MSFAIAGFLTGIIGGLFGVGGGEIFIPLLIYLFGFSQHQAQGTSLAVLLPPIGLLAALRYYRPGHVDFAVAGLLALGFFFGASIGAIVGTKIEGHTRFRDLRRTLLSCRIRTARAAGSGGRAMPVS